MSEKRINDDALRAATPAEQTPAVTPAPVETTGDYQPSPGTTGPFVPTPDAAAAGRVRPGPEAPDLSFLQPSGRPGAAGRLGHYEVLEVLGQGGFGIVLKARDEQLQRLVAIKVLGAQMAGNDTARQRFLREARAAAAVRDEHVVGVFEVAEDPLPYLAMEYVPGGSLQDRLDRTGPPGVEEIVRIGAEVAQGLAAAHAQGLVHRDVKPANILLEAPSPPTPLPRGERGEARARITDFGLAKAVDDVGLTQSGVITGTPLYMSPEQARGQPLDQRSDLFSLGSVLYALCTGQSPFLAARKLGVLKRVCEDTPRPIRTVNPAIPAWLAAIVARLLAKDPARRFQTAAEVADLLRRHLAHLRDPSLPEPPALEVAPETEDHLSPVTRRPGAKRPALRRRWLTVGGVAALVAGLAALPFLLPHRAPDSQTNPKQRTSELPAGPEEAEALARELLKEREVRWTALPAADLKSAAGATLIQHAENRSILVTGTDAEADVYTLALTDLPPAVAALRLEVLTHSSLPHKGPGRNETGDCSLAEIVLYHAGSGVDSPLVAVPIARAAADIDRDSTPIDQSFDGDPATGWRLGTEVGKTHWAVFQLGEPLHCAAGDRLLVRLEHLAGQGKLNLGRFRLSVSEDPAALEAHRLHEAVRKAGLRGFAALGAAFFCRGEHGQAVAALTRAGEAGAETGPVELLMLALAQQQLQQPDLARPPWERARALLPKSPASDVLRLLVTRALVEIEGSSPAGAAARWAELVEAKELAGLTAAIDGAAEKRDPLKARGTWYARRGRWRECAKDWLAGVDLDMGDREGWEVIAASLVLAGDPGPVSQVFDRLKQEAFRPPDDMAWWTCHIRCQVGQQWPEGVALDRLPLADLDQWLERGGGAGWNLPRLQMDRARVAYRRGNYEEALEWCRKALESGQKDAEYLRFKEQANSEVYSVRAMAEYRLKQYDDARRSYAAAAGLIPAELHGLGTADYRGTRPVDDQVLSGEYLADWLVAEVYRRQAERLLLPNLSAFLEGEYPPRDNAERLTLAVACRARGLHRLAAGLYADAFAAEPKRATHPRAGHRFAAACCAARVSTAADTAAPEKGRWRPQALRWLTEELAALRRALEDGTPAERSEMRQVVRQWHVEPDLTRVRDPFWVAALPAAERQAWGKLWADASALALQVRALAEPQRGRADDARRSFQEAAALVPAGLRALGTSSDRGQLPVAAGAVVRDWLIAEVLRREAGGFLLSSRPAQVSDRPK